MKGQQKKINVFCPEKKKKKMSQVEWLTPIISVWGTEVKTKISGSRPATAWTMTKQGFHKTKAKRMKK